MGVSGSSPHTRGAQLRLVLTRELHRIIPAYAGSTASRACTRKGRGDHPRIRGEHRSPGGASGTPKGSSPHTRGAPEQPSTKSPSCRIIPAYAGSTNRPDQANLAEPDHPRIRGEHETAVTPIWKTSGSSPHTRGARGTFMLSGGGSRIIPAYAGSTAAGSSCRGSGTDHPRIRGEHEPSQPAATLSPGSSPHTRGALRGSVSGAERGGIIPAYAGSTSRASRRRP